MHLNSFAVLRPLCAALGVAAAAVHGGVAWAADFGFSGHATFNTDVVTVAFTLAHDTRGVQLWTDAWLGGLNYDPTAAVWVASGSTYRLVSTNDDDGSLAPGQGAFDAGLRLDLAAGRYLFTVAAAPNEPLGPLLSDGFAFDGQTPIAIADWNQPGYDINANDQKGTLWRLHLSGVDAASLVSAVPEPSSAALLALGLGVFGVVARRQRRV